MRSICLAVLSIWAPSVYASAINIPFGTADSFAVLGGSTVTSTGPRLSEETWASSPVLRSPD